MTSRGICFYVVVTTTALCLSPSATLAENGYEQFENALKRYNSCFLIRLDRFKGSCEQIDAIAIAVVDGCHDEMSGLTSAAVRHFGVDGATKILNHTKAARKENAVSAIVEHRLSHPCG